MDQKNLISNLKKEGVLAVVTINDIDKTNYLCEALLNGGIKIIELTLRTDNAFKIINHISKNYADIIVGAGTILSITQLKKAIESGASYGVAPGIDPHVIEKSKRLDFTFAPGICTPSEIQLALNYELNLLKFFPAEYSGGLDYLKSIAAPFIQNDLKFIPLGGININTAKEYLHSNLVAAIGGSWIANDSLIVDGNWKEIEKRANEVHKLVAKVREPRL